MFPFIITTLRTVFEFSLSSDFFFPRILKETSHIFQSGVVLTVLACLFQVFMACQSMLIVLIGSTPEYRLEQQDRLQRVVFTEDVDTIVTEVRSRTRRVRSYSGQKLERCRSVSVVLSGFWWSSRPIRSVWPDRCSSPGSWSGTSCLGRCPTGSAGDPST